MITYSQFRPTQFDSHISLPEYRDWLVLPVGHNRDSEVLQESNWHVALEMLGGEGEDVVILRFGHWGNGWFEILIVRPHTPALIIAERIEDKLSNYPILSEDDLSVREYDAAQQVWATCYSNADRLDYIRKHKHDFEFHHFSSLMACVRGKTFAGVPSELLG